MAQAPTTRPEPPLLNSPVLKPGEPARSAANPVVAMFVKLPNNWPSGLNAGGVPRNPTCAAACDAAADGSAAARFWPSRSLREDRKSVVWGKSGAVRVDLGGRRNIKNKKAR